MAITVTKNEIDIRDKLSELDRPVGVAGHAMMKAETPQEQFNLINAGRRRLSINGCMSIWQRGTSMAPVPGGQAFYLADRFSFRESTDTVANYYQSTDVPPGQGFKYSIKINTTGLDEAIASTQYSRFQYNMEGQDALVFGYGTPEAKPVTVSFWVKSAVAGKYPLSIEVPDSYRVCIKSYTIDRQDTWEHKVVTFPPLTSSGVTVGSTTDLGWKLTMPLVVGSAYQDDPFEGKWRTDNTYKMGLSGCANPFRASGDIWFMTGVQIEVGSHATPFEHRSYGEELALCERYFFSLTGGYAGSTYLGSPVSPTGDNGIMNFAVWDTGNCYGVIHFPNSMRVPPSIANDGSQSEANSFRLFSANVNINTSNFKFMNSSTDRCELVFEHNGSLTTGNAGWVRLQNGAELWFDAELTP